MTAMPFIAAAFSALIVITAIVNKVNVNDISDSNRDLPSSSPVVVQTEVTSSASATINPTATPTPTPTNNNLDSVVYPGAEEIEEGVYQTTDDTDTVTDWYQNYIENNSYNVKNIVKTKVNGVVENKIKASGESGELSLLITNDEGATIIKFD